MIRAWITVDPGAASGVALTVASPARGPRCLGAWTVFGASKQLWLSRAEGVLADAAALADRAGAELVSMVIEVPPRSSRQKGGRLAGVRGQWEWFQLGRRAEAWAMLWWARTGAVAVDLPAGWARHIGRQHQIPVGKQAAAGEVLGAHRVREAQQLVPGARAALARLLPRGTDAERARQVDAAEACLMGLAAHLQDCRRRALETSEARHGGH